jgi:hypothetical protein
VPGALGSIGIGVAPDSVFNTGGQQKLINTWGARGGFNHNWDPNWSTSVYGAFASVDYGSTTTVGSAASTFCASLMATQPGVTNCNPNYTVVQAGIITRWTPVKNLTFSLDYTFQHLSQNNTGTIVFPGGSYGTGTYVLADQNTHEALIRAQRNF